MGAESFIGTTLWSSTGQPIGLIVVIGKHPLENSRLVESVLKLVTVRTAGELERRQAEAALRESEVKYRAVVENANDAIYVAQDGYISFANKASCLISGYTLEELRSKPLVEFAHPADRELVQHYHIGRIGGESLPTTNQTRILAKDGSIRWIEIRAVLFEWEGRPATLNFAVDITERKRIEEESRLNRELLRTVLDITPAYKIRRAHV